MKRNLALSLAFLFLAACAGKILQYERSAEILKVEEFDKKVKIKEEVEPPPSPVVKEDSKAAKAPAKQVKKRKHVGPRKPELEDSAGFDGRRPIVDPFRIGEKVTLNITYFNIVAGTIDLEVKPLVHVNGVKSYHFEVTGKSNSFFSRIYAVDDKATTYMSYEDMIPSTLQVSLKETGQLAETRTLFDWKNKRASYWQKRITKEKGERSKQIDWELLPYSQNIFSALFYLRTFELKVGKKLALRVADEGKNIVFTGEVIRQEKIETPMGVLDTLVMKPEVTVDGIFKPVGEVLVWLTNDDRKFIVQLKSKIKIGSVIAKLKSIEKGRE